MLRTSLLSCFLLFEQILPKVTIESVDDMIVISGQSSQCFGITVSPASADIDPETIMIAGYRVLRSSADLSNLTVGDLQSRGVAKLSDIYDKTTGQGKVIKCYFDTKNKYILKIHSIGGDKIAAQPVYRDLSEIITVVPAPQQACAYIKDYKPLGLKPQWTRREKITAGIAAIASIIGGFILYRYKKERDKKGYIKGNYDTALYFMKQGLGDNARDRNRAIAKLTDQEKKLFVSKWCEAEISDGNYSPDTVAKKNIISEIKELINSKGSL